LLGRRGVIALGWLLEDEVAQVSGLLLGREVVTWLLGEIAGVEACETVKGAFEAIEGGKVGPAWEGASLDFEGCLLGDVAKGDRWKKVRKRDWMNHGKGHWSGYQERVQ